MTARFARKFQTLSIVAVLVAILAIPAALALAQVPARNGGQASGESSVVPAPGALTFAQTPQPPLAPGAVGSQRVSDGAAQKKKSRPQDAGSLFQPVALYDSGENENYYWVAIADLNGDGIPDLVVAYNGNSGGALGVLLGNGDGTFQAPVAYDSGSSLAYMVVIADVNGDGKPDLVAVNGCGGAPNCSEGSIGVLLGNGDGTFQTATTFGTGGWDGYGAQVAVADLNGDGKPDVVVSNCAAIGFGNCTNGGTLGVLKGNGDGTFQPVVTYASGVGTSSLAVGDVNGDGISDLVAGDWEGSVAVLLGNGDGTFQPAVSYGGEVGGVHTVAIADMSGNGKPDILVGSCGSNGCGGNEGGGVGVLVGNGDGTFQPVVTYTAEWVMSIAVADVNLDGKPDVVVADWRGEVGVLLGNGDGTLQPIMTFASGASYSDSVALADLNGHGAPDVVVANYCINGGVNGCVAPNESSVGVLINNTEPTTTTLLSSLNPSIFGQAVLFTAAVISPSGTPTGTVIFYDGSTQLGSVTLANGSASLSTSALAVGSHSITAAYQGSSTFASSTSTPLNQVVNPATTTTSLASSANPARVKQRVTYTASVTGQFGGAATGTVTFQDNGATIATVTLSGNQAAYSTSYTKEGVHLITATYSGDANNAGSVSPVLIEGVGKPPFSSDTTLATSGSPSQFGQPVTFTATVTSKYGAIPNGELVTFYDGKTEIGTGTTASGVTTFTTSSLTAKKHTIKATYAGDAQFKPSTGKVIQVVEE